jgi:hypothetical protein
MALFSLLKILTFSPLSPSHHIKYAKRHKFRVLNIGKKITNYTILMYFATRISCAYTLHPKIFASFDFCASHLTIRLIQKNRENAIYFAMTCFIIIYILSISKLCLYFHKYLPRTYESATVC